MRPHARADARGGRASRSREGLPVMYVTEDTTRARPEDLRRLYTAAVEAGARRVCIADTVGHATPDGARSAGRASSARWSTRPARTSRSTGTATTTAASAVDQRASPRPRPAPTGSTARARHRRAGAATPHSTSCWSTSQLLGWSRRDLAPLAGATARWWLETTGVADPRQLPGRRPRRLPHADRRPRRGDHQGAGQGRRLARRPDLLRHPGRAWSAAGRRSRSVR